MPEIKQPLSLAVLAYEGVRPFQLSVPCEIFGEIHSPDIDIDVMVCALEAGPVLTSAGFSMTLNHGLDDLVGADLVIIPSWRLPYDRPPQVLIDALRQAHANGAIIVGLCLGAFILAEAGLLDGKRATTHWAFTEELSQRFPAVKVEKQAIYVDETDVLTSAGVTAGIDCCLHLAARLFGPHAANRIARNILAPPFRAGGQAQYIERPLSETVRDARLKSVLDDIVQNIAERHTVDAVAAKLAWSRRSFTRHFHQTMGVGFNDWLANERLNLAQRCLETTNRSVEQIAMEIGFGSVVTFRSRFQQRFGVSPVKWRKLSGQDQRLGDERVVQTRAPA